MEPGATVARARGARLAGGHMGSARISCVSGCSCAEQVVEAHISERVSQVLHLRHMTVPAGVLEELVARLTGLQQLDLSHCGLAALPTAVAKLSRLTDLHLNYNRLSKLPAGFSALTRLTDLGLSHNPQLRALPPGITRLARLQCLAWSVSFATPQPPPAQLAWLAALNDLALHGTTHFAEWARAQGILWPSNRTMYY
ncbi:Protein lap4 [Tetrabaena socialis]|uniref:Protein lap4 n=1 Tax=Tetrabaena socialis TaxID=47790 RepID=A0A2J7ZWU4_9CHLO|nr:Protein lap4 [Tetrabaena socialis]|eukprot:PNH04728.1 Protein lap4 [Tetrabaena socialis]